MPRVPVLRSPAKGGAEGGEAPGGYGLTEMAKGDRGVARRTHVLQPAGGRWAREKRLAPPDRRDQGLPSRGREGEKGHHGHLLGARREALTFACELSKKGNLLRVFEVVLGSLPSATWRSRLDEARAIRAERGFTLDQEDLIQLIVGALRRVPEGERSQSLIVSRALLGDDGHRNVIGLLLQTELNNPDGSWHLLAREQLGEVDYRRLIAKLEDQELGKVAEPAAPYDVSKAKMTQRRLFD